MENTEPQFLVKALSHELLSLDQEQELAHKVQEGCEDSKVKLFLSNLKLVKFFCSSIVMKKSSSSNDFKDAFSEGCVGLWTAIGKYKPVGKKFSSFANFYIRSSIYSHFSENCRSVRIPKPESRKLASILKAEDELRGELGRDPTTPELMDRTGLKEQTVLNLLNCGGESFSLDASLPSKTISFSSPSSSCSFNSEKEKGLNDENTPLTNLKKNESYSLLNKALLTLSPREQNILRDRFPLDGGRARTLEEIGIELGFTKEAVRKIQNQALRKVRTKLEKINKEKK
tara:strand:+ start:4253 stop:5110 length:858 start_codon:yes stop_codon:yes gene_type:complete